MDKKKYDVNISETKVSSETKKNINKKYIIVGVVCFFVLLIAGVIVKNISTYPDDVAPSFVLNTNSITVTSNQKDRIRFSKSSIKYRIKEKNSEYGEWQESNEFSNLEKDVYFIQSGIFDSNGKQFISNETEVRMYKGELVNLDGKMVATESGGLYTIPYYQFKEEHTHTEKCPNSGRRAGVWGDTDLKTCSLCGAKNVASRTGEREKYTTWNGYTAYRDVYAYTDHNRTVTTYEYNYSYSKNEGTGKLSKTYYAKSSDNNGNIKE